MAATIQLAGQIAIVTGASRGIGRETALALARAGAFVVCVSTSESGSAATVQAIEKEGLLAESAACDVGQTVAVESLAERVLRQHGHVDVLVNNAGITKDTLLFRMTDEDFDRVLAVNLRGTFLMTRAFARPMLKARKGRIVNVSSVVGLTGNAGQANYAASKAGIIGMTKSVAKELGSRGVTANVVAPGFIDTDMTASLAPEIKAGALKNIPAARFGTPADVAGAIVFLASELAAYVTGQVIVVDGGLTM